MVGAGQIVLEVKGEGDVDVSGAEPSWEWVVVGVVRGRGKGVVARAERALRVWVCRFFQCSLRWQLDHRAYVAGTQWQTNQGGEWISDCFAIGRPLARHR